MKCEFDQTEMEERLIELTIASTLLEDFQRNLLGKEKRYKLFLIFFIMPRFLLHVHSP